MKGLSKPVVAGAVLVVISLAMVIGLLLFLLAQLYCSLFFRRQRPHRQSHTPAATTIPAIDTSKGSHPQQKNSTISILGSFHAQGVLRAPRSFLFPSVLWTDEIAAQSQVFDSSPIQQSDATVDLTGSNVNRLESRLSLSENDYVKLTFDNNTSAWSISNPIYDNDAHTFSRVDITPFGTPDSSPSQLETADPSGDEDFDSVAQSVTFASTSSFEPGGSLMTTPLTPMKQLPAEACSVSLRDAGSLGNSGADSHSHNRGISSSESPSSPRTSPLW